MVEVAGADVEDAGRPGRDGVHAPQRLVEHEPERVHVHPRVRRFAVDLLGRHVERGAELLLQRGLEAPLVELGQAEVDDLDHVLRGDEQVLRLEVAVDEPVPVRRGHPLGRLAHPARRRLAREAAARHRQRVTEAPPFHQLEDEEEAVPVDAGVEEAHHVGVVDERERRPLLGEARAELGQRLAAGGEDLEGAVVAVHVDDLVDVREAPAAEQAEHPVAAAEFAAREDGVHR